MDLIEGRAFAIFILILVIIFVLFVFSCGFFLFGVFFQKKKTFIDIKNIRKDAVNRSRSIIGGQVSEQLAPFFPNFPCNPGDVRFVGKPIDFVGFPGASDGKPIEEVLIIEVKTGKSQLNQREKEIKDAIDNGRVRYVVYRID